MAPQARDASGGATGSAAGAAADVDLDRVRQQLTPEKLQETGRKVIRLAAPHLLPGARNLVYVLAQSNRIGHFGPESQIIRTLYEDAYDRIVVVAGGRADERGTNPWIPACTGPKTRYVYSGDFDVRLFGLLDGGMQRNPAFDLLLAHPRTLFTSFYRHILDGGRVKQLDLAPAVEDRARATLARNGVDADEPFVLFHVRTLNYLPGVTHHEHRTAEITSYRDSVARLIEAGYRVIRIGEPGLDTMGFDPRRYVSVPDWQDNDRAVDLYACARCTFAVAQNSGPIWVVAAFGKQVLRTNVPFDLLNLPYRDDLSLFRQYRKVGTAQPLTYRQILAARLPAYWLAEDIAASGYEMMPNTATELLGATEEMLERVAGRWQRDEIRQERFRQLSEGFHLALQEDPELIREGMAFYGYGYRYGAISQSFLDANPGFLE